MTDKNETYLVTGEYTLEFDVVLHATTLEEAIALAPSHVRSWLQAQVGLSKIDLHPAFRCGVLEQVSFTATSCEKTNG